MSYKKAVTKEDLEQFPELAEAGYEEGQEASFEEGLGLPHPPTTPIKPPLTED